MVHNVKNFPWVENLTFHDCWQLLAIASVSEDEGIAQHMGVKKSLEHLQASCWNILENIF